MTAIRKVVNETVKDARHGLDSWRVIMAGSLVAFVAALLNAVVQSR